MSDMFDEIEDENNEENEIDMKAIMLYQIETWSFLALVNNIFGAYKFRVEWNRLQEKRSIVGQILADYGREALSFYIKNLDEDEDLNMSQEEYKKIEEKLEICLQIIDLIENDTEVQDAFCQRLNEIIDDDYSEKSLAIKTQTIQELIYISKTISTIEKNSGNNIQDKMVECMEHMSTKEVLKIFTGGVPMAFYNLPKVNEEILRRVDEMTDNEFLIFVLNSDFKALFNKSSSARKILLEKLQKEDDTFSTIYMGVFAKYDDFLEMLLKKVQPSENVNAIVEAGVEKLHGTKVNRKMVEIIENFTDEEFVRYLIYCPKNENIAIAPCVQERVKKLSDDDIKFLFYIYDKREASPKEPLFEDCLIERNLLKEYDGIYDFIPTPEEEEIYQRRYSEYSYTEQLFLNLFPLSIKHVVGLVDPDDNQKSEANVIHAYNYNEDILKNYENFLNYYKLLAHTKDEDLFKTVLKFNNDQLSKNNMDADKAEYYKFLLFYLGSRVLKMDDENLLNKLFLLSHQKSMYINTVMTRMVEKNMDLPRLDVTIKKGNNEGSDKLDNGEIEL